MILIGSRALKLRQPFLISRSCKDFDFVCTKYDFDIWYNDKFKKNAFTKNVSYKNKIILYGKTNCEFELISNDTSSELLLDLVKKDSDTLKSKFGLIPSLDLLFTIKSSHKYLKNSPHFWKNLFDYHTLKTAGCKIRPEYNLFLKKREDETYIKKINVNLNKSKNDFFKNNNVNYIYDHDHIHESVKRFNQPAYKFYLKIGSEVLCDKEKFFNCSKEVQLYGVIEEACTIAIERTLLHYPKINPKHAWLNALSKICTTMTSGFFRDFAYDNCIEILKMYPENFWIKFNDDVKSGKFNKI